MPLRPKPTQKQIERAQLDRFLSVASGLPSGLIVEAEEPDFLILCENTIGVELTDLYWSAQPGVAPFQAVEGLRSRIAELAEHNYSSRGLPPLHVSIHFNPNYSLTKRDVPGLATAISDLVEANLPAEGGVYREEYDWDNRAHFPEELLLVSAWRLASLKRSFFSAPSAAFIPDMSREDIERILLAKANKVERYLRKCDQIWLVINCDGGNLSNVFDVDEEVFRTAFETPFDRVFVFRHMAGKVHELRLSR